MDPKSQEALREWGPRKILGELVNVLALENAKPAAVLMEELKTTATLKMDANTQARAKRFIERYGPLRPYVDAEIDLIVCANQFRAAWKARTEAEIARVNLALDDIFTTESPDAALYADRPFFKADFGSGILKPIPRTLLDALAIELVRARKMLHRCEQPECTRYFVKLFSRERYCSTRCGDLMRGAKQRRWAEGHKEELNRKRRKPKTRVWKRHRASGGSTSRPSGRAERTRCPGNGPRRSSEPTE